MNRGELLATARGFFVAVAVAAMVMIATGYLSEKDAIGLAVVGFLGFFIGVGGTIAGVYYLVRGLLRPAAWTPSSRDLAMTGFNAEKETKELARLIELELPGAAVTFEEEPLERPWPRDERSNWQRFVTSNRVIHEQQLLRATVRDISREYVICSYYGRSTESPRVLWSRITFEGRCASVRGAGDGPTAAAQLNESPELKQLVDKLLRGVFHWRGRAVIHPQPGLRVWRDSERTRVIIDTLPAEVFGGFGVRLGLAEFKALLDGLETVPIVPGADATLH